MASTKTPTPVPPVKGKNCVQDGPCQDWKKLPCQGGQFSIVSDEKTECIGPTEVVLPSAKLKSQGFSAKINQKWNFENDECLTTSAYSDLDVSVRHINGKEYLEGSRKSNFKQVFNFERICC